MLYQTHDKRVRRPLSWGKSTWQSEGIMRMTRVLRNGRSTWEKQREQRHRVTEADCLPEVVSAWRVGPEGG